MAHFGADEGAVGAAAPAEGYSLSDYEGLVSVVIPAFNETERITRCIEETWWTMETLGCRYEIVLVDDGSNDDTRDVAMSAAAALMTVRLTGYEENRGKGYALVHGAQSARGDLVLFMDADLEVHPRQLSVLYATLVGARADVVIGSKLHKQSRVDYPRNRRVLSRGYYAFVRSLFNLPVKDTQTGLKLYRREVLKRVGARMLVKRYAADLEALVNANRLGYKIVEAPVIVTREREFPRIGLRDAAGVFRDTLAIFYRTYLRRYYDRPEHEQEEIEPGPRAEPQSSVEALPLLRADPAPLMRSRV
jgi:glycosyltransferase involved in cell wall biosynthesis